MDFNDKSVFVTKFIVRSGKYSALFTSIDGDNDLYVATLLGSDNQYNPVSGSPTQVNCNFLPEPMPASVGVSAFLKFADAINNASVEVQTQKK